MRNIFVLDSNDTYISPDLTASYDRIVKQNDGSYEFIRQNLDKYLFNQAGKLARIIEE